ncbi:hypothetical protein JCM3766R1_004107 [Sporobolomyces carnicolor]
MSTDAMKPLSLTLIVAATNQANAIGRNGQLPWRLSKEMNYFARVTKGEPSGSVNGIDGRTRMNAVIMGRKSWQGIPAKFKPLADRINVVVTRQSDFDLQVSSLVSCAKKSTTRNADSPGLNRAFLIGGAQLYNEALVASSSSPTPSPHLNYSVDRILLTRVLTDFTDCDTFLHPFDRPQPASSGSVVEWKRASDEELDEWVGWQVPRGVQSERDRLHRPIEGQGGGGGEEEGIVRYQYEMWTRVSKS